MSKLFIMAFSLYFLIGSAYAEGLPANPWLNNQSGINNSYQRNVDNNAEQNDIMMQQINQAMQKANEAMKELSQKITNSSSNNVAAKQNNQVDNNTENNWQQLLKTFNENDLHKETSQSSFNFEKSKELYEMNRDYQRYKKEIEQKYKKMKNTANQYYNSAKQGAEKIGRTVEQNVQETQKLLK